MIISSHKVYMISSKIKYKFSRRHHVNYIGLTKEKVLKTVAYEKPIIQVLNKPNIQ